MISDIPEILKKYPNWVAWRSIVREGKATKVPFDVRTGRPAKANDPETWTNFEVVMNAADVLGDGKYDGIGFELHGTNLVGIDFDSSVNSKGVIDPYVLSVLQILGSPYTETSPSTTGLHSFVECDVLPVGGRKMSQGHIGIEIYHGREGGRYFTITGEKVLGAGVPTISDMTLPYLLISKNKDKKFRKLWLGDVSDHAGDDSSADFTLMLHFAQYTHNDPAAMEKFFGMSALGQREKWERNDYRQRTINAAITAHRTGKKVAPPSFDIEFHLPAVPDPDGEYVVGPAEGQFDGWFPLGDISLIGGASGTGKTSWIFDMLHKQKQNILVLGHKTFGYTFQVLAYDRGKNAFARTMRRLNLLASDVPTIPLELSFGTDAVQNIINTIEKLTPIPNIIFIEGLDMLIDDANKKSIVSPFMRNLQAVAAHFHIALIASVGAPKTKRGEDYSAKRDKISGSEAWGRNCETVVVLEFCEEDDGTAPQRALSVLPRNASAEKFTLEFQGGKLIQVEAREQEEDKNLGGRPNKALQTAMDFLYRELQHGPQSGNDLIKKALEFENIKRSTLYMAADEIGVKKDGRVHGHAVWQLTAVGVQGAISSNKINFGSES